MRSTLAKLKGLIEEMEQVDNLLKVCYPRRTAESLPPVWEYPITAGFAQARKLRTRLNKTRMSLHSFVSKINQDKKAYEDYIESL